jgi:hypothetical protein
MSKRRHRQPFAAVLGHRTTPPCFPYSELPNIVPAHENDDSSVKLDIVDAVAKEIDLTWAIIAVIEILIREGGDDRYAQGGLALAHAHLDGLTKIQEMADALHKVA